MAQDFEQFAPYWTAEGNWHSELQMRNNLASGNLTVTPVLRNWDGHEFPLFPVTIAPNEIKSVDVASAVLAQAPQLVGSYGSVVFRYHSPSMRNLYAAVMVMETGYPIAFHMDAFAQATDYDAGSREGIWWLPKDSTSDYLILTNQGSTPIPLMLSIYNDAGKESKQQLFLGALETSRYSVRKLVQVAGLTGSYGGIKVAATAHAGSLDTLHFLFDETAGFSAMLKMFDHDPATTLQERDYAHTGIWTQRAPMLALSNPDPALAFPPGTALHPQLLVRNITDKPADAALRFNWRTDSAAGPAAGPALHLNPYETRLVDVAALQSAGTLPMAANWTSVTLTTKGLPDEVVAVAASYDSSLRYGAQTPFSDQLTSRWEGGMWEYDPYHDSIITAGNGGAKPTRTAFTIFYNQGAKRFDLEQTLQPEEQMWIDVGKLIREHIQDKNGNTLPAELTSGSYEFRDLTNTGAGKLFEGKVIYDKTYGHVAYGCAECCGFEASSLWYNPIGVAVSTAVADGVNALSSCTNTFEDVSSTFYNNWSSANTSIATVNYYGTHSGIVQGSTTSQTFGSLDSPKGKVCPLLPRTPTGGVNVGPAAYLVVVADQQGPSAVCPTTGVQLRQMQMRVVDADGNTVPNSPSVVEVQAPAQPANSCGNGSPVPAGCAPTASASTFIDNMSVSENLCGSGIIRSSGCGFTVTSTWSACAPSGSNPLWVSSRTTKSNVVTVDGNSTSFVPGTICNATGCH